MLSTPAKIEYQPIAESLQHRKSEMIQTLARTILDHPDSVKSVDHQRRLLSALSSAVYSHRLDAEIGPFFSLIDPSYYSGEIEATLRFPLSELVGKVIR